MVACRYPILKEYTELPIIDQATIKIAFAMVTPPGKPRTIHRHQSAKPASVNFAPIIQYCLNPMDGRSLVMEYRHFPSNLASIYCEGEIFLC